MQHDNDPDGALPGDIALLDALKLTPEQRTDLVSYAARQAMSIGDILMQWMRDTLRRSEAAKLGWQRRTTNDGIRDALASAEEGAKATIAALRAEARKKRGQ